MSEELKIAIAKTLLITQLFSPFNIKFASKIYKEYNETTNKYFNNFIIEKTNPFNEQNITFEPELLSYENRDEAIEELMKSVNLNLKISDKAKQNINSIKKFLRDNPHIDLKILYNLLGKLEIEKTNDSSASYTMRTSSQFYMTSVDESGIILPNKATIYLNDAKLNDEVFLRAFFHELIHLSGWFDTYKEAEYIGNGLSEGMTSLIEYDYYGDLSGHESYFFLRTCTKMLAELIGEDKLLQCFSNRSLLNLQLQLQNIGILEFDIVQLIINLDKYKNSSIEELKILSKEVISFFEKYKNLIKDDISRYIYDSYLYDLENCQNLLNYNKIPYQNKNSVEKVYYNSEKLKENPIPYFTEYVFFESLEYLSYPYTIIEKDMKNEIALIQVFIDEHFINATKEKRL